MSPSEYEKIVSEIISGIMQSAPGLSPHQFGCGAENYIEGASGYKHQIDVSFLSDHGPCFLVECKKWNRKRKIGVAEILVLAGRGADIFQMKSTSQSKMIMASTTGATGGARKLANHFGIELSFVKNAHEFGIKIGKMINLGFVESVQSLGASIISGEHKSIR